MLAKSHKILSQTIQHRVLDHARLIHNLTCPGRQSQLDLTEALTWPQYYSHQKRHSSRLQMIPGIEVEITEDEGTNTTHIKSIACPTGREGKVVPTPDNTINDKACSLCRLNLRNLSYTDVLILEQFIGPDGKQFTRHESNLCQRKFMLVKTLIEKARRCNLIDRPSDYFVPGPWHDLNTYLERDRKRDQPMRVVKKQYWK